tara:strand:+ start:1394 stop:2071 length:678 start_codon:yes stop_codon:yes gene_type:complete
MSRSNHALVLFARAPKQGKVKTRLQEKLSPKIVFQLYSCFLQDSIEKIGAVEGVDRFIGAAAREDVGYFLEVGEKKGIRVFPQDGRDLGTRMRNAFQERFEDGYEMIVIIGSDSPSLPVQYIEKALETNRDIVLGPGVDGGYYLIGMRKRLANVFNGVDWGSDRVLKQTLDNLRGIEASLEMLPLWYDVDLLEDALFLKTHLNLLRLAGENVPCATVDYLNKMNL